ncbi:MAG: hypothetical protein QW332_06130 [Thermoproteota archaeon]
MICPLLGICREQVTLEKYRDVCINVISDEFTKCPKYKEYSTKTMSPLEWQRALSK